MSETITPRLVGPKVLAKALGVSNTAIYNYVRRDCCPVPVHKIGDKPLFKFLTKDIEEFLGAPLAELLGEDNG